MKYFATHSHHIQTDKMPCNKVRCFLKCRENLMKINYNENIENTHVESIHLWKCVHTSFRLFNLISRCEKEEKIKMISKNPINFLALFRNFLFFTSSYQNHA